MLDNLNFGVILDTRVRDSQSTKGVSVMSEYLDKSIRSEEEAAADIRSDQIRQMRAIIARAYRLVTEMEKLMKLKD